jgi:hypothetical protein
MMDPNLEGSPQERETPRAAKPLGALYGPYGSD